MRRLVALPILEDEEQTRVAGLVRGVTQFFLVGSLVYGVLILSSGRGAWPLLLAAGLALTSVLVLTLLRRGHVLHAGGLLVGALWVCVTAASSWPGNSRGSVTSGYIVVVVLAGLLLGSWAAFVGAGLSILSSLGMAMAQTNGLLPGPAGPAPAMAQWAASSLYLVAATAVVHFGAQSAIEALARGRAKGRELAARNQALEGAHASLQRELAERTRGLQASTEVSRVATSMLDPEELLPQAAHLIRERFSLYYVGLFLLDQDREYAVLRAGTGEAGQEMLARSHQLEIGGNSMIGQCVYTNQARIALDVGREAIRFDNPLLPDTRSELALPLRSRGRVTGAMTVQSEQAAAFDEADVAVLQNMADQVAVAIDNAQLFAEAQEALARSEKTVQRYVRESWNRLVEMEERITAYRYAPHEAERTQEAWSPAMEEAVRRGDLALMADVDTGPSLGLPLVSGGQVIGAMGLRKSPGEAWIPEEITLVQAVGEQVAQALERMRLLEETRSHAHMESILRRTSERVRAQASLDAILQAAVTELRQAVGATRVALKLGTGDTLANEETADVVGRDPSLRSR